MNNILNETMLRYVVCIRYDGRPETPWMPIGGFIYQADAEAMYNRIDIVYAPEICIIFASAFEPRLVLAWPNKPL